MLNRFFAWVNPKPTRSIIGNVLALALGVIALPFVLALFLFLAFIAAIFGLALK